MAEKNLVSEEILRNLMLCIQSALPEGYRATNKKPIRKEVRRLGSCYADTFWTSWVKNTNGETFLALLNGESIKLIPSEEVKSSYIINNSKV